MKERLISVIVGLALAILTLIIVKYFLVDPGTIEATKAYVFRLEIIIIFILIAAFLYKEIINGIKHLLTAPPDENYEMQLEPRDAIILLGSFLASMSIYLFVAPYLPH